MKSNLLGLPFWAMVLVACRSSAPDATAIPECAYHRELVWTQLETSGTSPEARLDPALVTDSAGHRLLLFGGRSTSVFLDDFWIMNAEKLAWSRVETGAGPAPRSGSSMVFDPASQRAILFGGYPADSNGRTLMLRELWALSDGGAWSREYFKEGPAGRAWQSAIVSGGEMIMFGGFGEAPYHHMNDVWSLDLESMSFRRLATDGGPRMAGRAAILPTSDGQALWIAGRNGIPKPDSAGFWLLESKLDRWSFYSAGLEDQPVEFDLSLAHPDAKVLMLLRGPAGERQVGWHAWIYSIEDKCLYIDTTESGPQMIQGLSCAPDPVTSKSWICFGGGRGNTLSNETWRLKLSDSGANP
jgi:hypothetical protein